MLRVVRALCAHDETLSAGLGDTRASRAARTGGGPGGQQLPAQIIVQAPDGTLARTLDALRVRIIDGTASSWWDGYGHARAYHAEHGNLDVRRPRTSPPAGSGSGPGSPPSAPSATAAPCPPAASGTWTTSA